MKAPVNIVGPAYLDDVLPASAQECINWVPCQLEADGGRSRIILRDAPGLTSFATVGTGPIRGVREVNETLFVVSGTGLYTVSSTGVVSASLGTVAGTGRVVMSHNFVTDGDGVYLGAQIAMVNGAQGYIYDTQTSGFSQITDPDWTASDTVAYQGGYLIFETATGFRISDIRDGLNFNALNFEVAEVNPDGARAVLVDHEELWVFGQRTIEVFQNTGNTDFPFERNSGATIEKGLAAIYTPIQADNSVYWLADDGQFYMAQGYTPVRVSTYAIEQDLTETGLADWFTNTWVERGATFVSLTHPSGKTWVFDIKTRLWHRRKSFGLDRWRASHVINVYSKNLVGDYEDGTLWELDNDAREEGDDPFVRERVTGYVHSEQMPVFFHGAELVMNTGNAPLVGEDNEVEPVVELRYSDDFGRTWSNWKRRSLGTTGQYGKTIRFAPMGRSLNRLFHIRVTDPVRSEIVASNLNISTGVRQ